MKHLKLPLLLCSLFLLCTWNGSPRAGPEGRARAVDVYVVSDQVFVPGSKGAIRVAARAVHSMTSSRPAARARVAITLSGKGKRRQLFAGRSDARGGVEARFRLPDWPAGSYQMAVNVQSAAGGGKVQRTVQLKRAGRVLLVTDKPIYQPRQTMHMRALALSSHDLRPLGKEQIRFEVIDPKGNKVFKKELATNGYGIAATTFQLADEINLGNYQIEVGAVNKGLAEPASKTVVVKKYVLPKFKVNVETDRAYYLPKQWVKGTVRSDYFFGKPVSGGKVVIDASTFDGVSFKKFYTVKGRTHKNGTWKFMLRLPDYFVGQPLLKGNALVRLAVKVKDTANHTEKSTRSLPVSATSIRLTALPEGGRLVLGVPNQVYVVATYPDGSPAKATVTAKRKGRTFANVRTDAAGLGVLKLTPRVKQMRTGGSRSRVRFGRHVGYVRTRILDLQLTARDARGNTATVKKSFSTDPERDQLLLRTDKAIYRGGDLLRATVLGTVGGADTVYVDLIKNRQTLLTRAVRRRGGRAALTLPLGPDLFGTLELHAYQIKSDGEIVRDARVLYVHPPSELKIEVSPDKKVYRPGDKALIRFSVTDAAGNGRPSALGLIVVDEAVYALQELKPGLEKVYFTLERELSKPKYQIELGPADSLQSMVKVRQLQARRQRVAKVLLAKAKPIGKPGLWDNPVAKRMQKVQQDFWSIRNALQSGVQRYKLAYRTDSGRWAYRPGLIRRLVKHGQLSRTRSKDPFGKTYSVRSIERLWPELRANRLLPAVDLQRLWNLHNQVRYEVNRRTKQLTKLGGRSLATHIYLAFRTTVKQNPDMARDPVGRKYTWGRVRRLPGFRVRDIVAATHNQRVSNIYYGLSRYGRDRLRKDKRGLDEKKNIYVLPGDAVRRAVKEGKLDKRYAWDVWGRHFRLRRRGKPVKPFYFDRRLRLYAVVSAGPDGVAGTADDLTYPRRRQQEYKQLAKALGVKPGTRVGWWGPRPRRHRFRGRRRRMARPTRALAPRAAPAMEMDLMDGAMGAGGGGGGRVRTATVSRSSKSSRHAAGPAAPKKRKVRVRQYFPETLLFKPALITDGQGRAQLELKMADSITTWRMTASANSADGSLGSVSRGVRVFQDFFVDLDLPVALTQNDEVSIPVVVYNYLKKPQRVRLELKRAGWFELKGGRVQELTIQPSEVAATYYRIKVRGLGRRTLQVRADGSAMSDAIKRQIEVLPDGKEINLVANGRLRGTVSKTIRVPRTAVPGASKILVRLYPGVFSQVIEGMESMLRLPGG